MLSLLARCAMWYLNFHMFVQKNKANFEEISKEHDEIKEKIGQTEQNITHVLGEIQKEQVLHAFSLFFLFVLFSVFVILLCLL